MVVMKIRSVYIRPSRVNHIIKGEKIIRIIVSRATFLLLDSFAIMYITGSAQRKKINDNILMTAMSVPNI